MQSKYYMSVQDNIFFAKRKEIDNVYCSAILENINVSFEDVVAFYNNVNTGNISIDDMLKLKGLKDCWEMVLGSIEEPLTMDYIKKVHFEICKGQSVSPLGEYRDCGVGITGTNWRPKLPSECDYDKELANIMKIDSPIDRCITLFCWIQRSQMFKDGNKRVANLVANKEMIKNGQGIIAIPVINCITNPILNYIMMVVVYLTSNNVIIYFLFFLFEIMVIDLEYRFYKKKLVFKKISLLLLSIMLNISSLILGLIISVIFLIK